LPAGEGQLVASGVHSSGSERQSGDESPHSINGNGPRSTSAATARARR
jgi:hypothetical protein